MELKILKTERNFKFSKHEVSWSSFKGLLVLLWKRVRIYFEISNYGRTGKNYEFLMFKL